MDNNINNSTTATPTVPTTINNQDQFSVLRRDPLLAQFLDSEFSCQSFLSTHLLQYQKQPQHQHEHNNNNKKKKHKKTKKNKRKKQAIANDDDDDENTHDQNVTRDDHDDNYIEGMMSDGDDDDENGVGVGGDDNEDDDRKDRTNLERLQHGISHIDRQIHQLVVKHEQGLVNQTVALHSAELENELKAIREHVNELQSSVNRLQSRYMIGQQSYSGMIQSRIIQLRNMIQAVDMMRFVDKILTTMIKVQKTIAQLCSAASTTGQDHHQTTAQPESNKLDHELFSLWVNRELDSKVSDVPSGMAYIALYLYELENNNLLEYDKDKSRYLATGVHVIDQELNSLRSIRKTVLEFSLAVLLNGCRQFNQSQIASSSQVFFNMNTLYSVINEQIISKNIASMKKDRVIVQQILTAINRAISQRVNVSNLALPDLFSEYRNMIKEIHTLETVLRKKRCSHTGTLLISVVPATKTGTTITEQFWHDMSRLITSEFSSHQIRTLIQQDSRQLRAKLTEFVDVVVNLLPNSNFDFNTWITTCL